MKNKILNIITAVLVFLFFICLLASLVAGWYNKTYGDVGFDAILYTLFSELGGTAFETYWGYIVNALFPAVVVLAVISLLLFWSWKKKLTLTVFKRKLTLVPFNRVFVCILLVLASCFRIYVTADLVSLGEYIKNTRNASTVFERYYVSPDDVSITFPEEKRNLIFISMESIETSFFSYAGGGAVEVSAIPELHSLCEQYINFSQNAEVGGHKTVHGGQWTMAAIVAQTAGIPLKPPRGIDGNEYGENGALMQGVSTLSDILGANGYYQVFMCGSESRFAGKREFFFAHGYNKIYDYYTAVEDGIIPAGHCDISGMFGMADRYLYEYAKQELPKLAASDRPFAITLMLVDSHAVGGIYCDNCTIEYGNSYGDALVCTSKQLYAFIEWIKEQPFFENTTIVLTGDHDSMDAPFLEQFVDPSYDRRLYNCFINSAVLPIREKNREATQLDMFPTILASIGCTIEGEQLGLGVNLFSDKPTLSEQLGFDYFNGELAKHSNMYYDRFVMGWKEE